MCTLCLYGLFMFIIIGNSMPLPIVNCLINRNLSDFSINFYFSLSDYVYIDYLGLHLMECMFITFISIGCFTDRIFVFHIMYVHAYNAYI